VVIRVRVLAIDGGQSAIRALSTQDADVVEVSGVSRDGSTEDRVVDGVVSAWRSLGTPVIDRAVLGLTTAPEDPAHADSLAERIGTAVGAAEVWVCDDAVTSHAGALSCGWGVSVTAGTGVACLAVPDRGRPRIIGGHGYLLGDEGGGFWIGREGLRAALRAVEGRASPTVLRDLATERFGVLNRLPVRLHEDPRAVDLIARFATDVFAAAGDDSVAADIVEKAADELHGVASAAVDIIAPEEAPAKVPVALGGRLLSTPTPLRHALDSRLRSDQRLEVRTADGSPLDGAMSIGTRPTPGRYASLVQIWRGGEA
jgi:glucosamine kinase